MGLEQDLFGDTNSTGTLESDLFPTEQREKSWMDIAGIPFKFRNQLVAGGLEGASTIGATLLAPVDWAARQAGISNDLIGRTDRREASKRALEGMGADPESAAYQVGKVGTQIAGTAGVGGAIARPFASVAPRFAAALASGGASNPAVANTLGQFLTRTAGSAVGGGVGAGLIDPTRESIGTGAAFGAFMPVAGEALKLGTRGAGWLKDLMTGGTQKLAERHVGRIARESADDAAAAISARNAVADPDLLATQASAGINKPTWNALGAWAEKHGANTYDPIRQEQKALQRLTLSDIAGGETQTAARDTAKGAKETLNQLMTPVREKILADANIGAKVGIPLQNEADRMATAVASKVDDVRRISIAQQKAEELAQKGYGTLAVNVPRDIGMPRISGKYSYPGELANVAEEGAQKAADASTLFGDAARFAKMKAESVSQAGYKPINTGKLISALEAKLNSPQIWPSDPDAKAIATVIAKLKEGNIRGGGVIESDAIYTIRKNTIGDAIESQLVGYDPKAKAERVSAILTKIKPMIDDAINEAAGSKDWTTKYLRPFTEGMQKIEQKQMGAKSLEMFDKSPEGFAELARGNNPKQVQKIFKTEYDIQKAMGNQFPGMRNVGNEVLRDAEIARQAGVGATQFDEIFRKHQSGLRAPGLIDATITVINKALGNIEGRINDNIKTTIINGMRSGADANKLLAMIPAEERSVAMQWIAMGGPQRYLTGAASTIGGNTGESQ